VHPDDLIHHNCLSFPNPLWHFTAPSGETLERRVEGNLSTNSHQLLRAATIAGLGVTYGFPVFFEADLRAGRVVRLMDEYTAGAAIEVHAFFPPGRYRPLRTRAFVDALLGELSAHAEPG
jgi:DNA-binding transcriptional LysR family regulator